jgi:acyl-CoA reductase-like NAD-dependent aldehyde dehydrogenase
MTAADIQRAAARTREARDRVLQHHDTDAIVAALAQTASRWLAPDSPWRARAAAEAPACTGFSPEMIHEAVRLTFGEWTREALQEMLERELGSARALDDFCPRGRLRAKASGPRLIAHILAGNVPPPGILSIGCGLLLRAGNLVRPSSRDPVFPRLFVESLREADAELAELVAVLDWDKEQTPAALSEADAVIAYGEDRTIETLRTLAPPSAKFVGYGHRLSFAVVAKEAMRGASLPAVAEAAAFDASVYDQQGCLSPHVFYVEEGGELGGREFAAALAGAMAAYQARVPRGTLSVEEAAVALQTRQAWEFRAASDRRVSVWAGRDWTVVYEDNPAFTVSCLNRTVFVKPTEGLQRVVEQVRPLGGKISTVGVAPLNARAMALAGELARLGVHRVCPIGRMQRPPLAWYHDGRPNLGDLTRWTDVG